MKFNDKGMSLLICHDPITNKKYFLEFINDSEEIYKYAVKYLTDAVMHDQDVYTKWTSVPIYPPDVFFINLDDKAVESYIVSSKDHICADPRRADKPDYTGQRTKQATSADTLGIPTSVFSL